jgi:predicted nucleic acid-binding protein
VAVARFLVDTSAAARMNHSEVADRLSPLIAAGLVATCAPLDAEALYSARSLAAYEQLRRDRRTAYAYVPTDDRHWALAFEVQHELARSGRHRAVGIADLLTSSIAVENGLEVIHYNSDFDVVAEVLPLKHRWVVKRGSIP